MGKKSRLKKLRHASTQNTTLLRIDTEFKKFNKKYPGFCDAMAHIRLSRKHKWPDIYYIPICEAMSVIKCDSIMYKVLQVGGMDALNKYLTANDISNQLHTMVAHYAWEATKLIYRFHPNIIPYITDTPLEGNIPTDMLFHFPVWCPYIETPGFKYTFNNRNILGFFVYLNIRTDLNLNNPSLRFLLHLDDKTTATYVINIEQTIDESIKRDAQTSLNYKRMCEHLSAEDEASYLSRVECECKKDRLFISALLNIVLYLCAKNSDIRESSTNSPSTSKPKSKREDPPDSTRNHPLIYEVGYRIGARVGRKDKPLTQTQEERKERKGRAVRPHVRQAHWHHFWKGSKKDPERRELVHKWLCPILVRGRKEDMIPTIRPVDAA
jgi:hypothetical protein